MGIKTRECANCGASVSRPKSRAVEFGTVNVQHKTKKFVRASYRVATRVVCKDRRACAGRIAAALKPLEQNPNHVPNPNTINAPGGPLTLAPRGPLPEAVRS